MSKKNNKKEQHVTQAIVTPDARDQQTNRAVPNQSHVRAAKEFVDKNHK